MPSVHGEMSRRSHAAYPGGTQRQRAHRGILRAAMEADGLFKVHALEWWHYDFKDFREYDFQDIPFSAIPAPGAK